MDGTTLGPDEFTFDPVHGWVSVGPEATTVVTVRYVYSVRPDLAVTNYNADEGNYLYYNLNDALAPPARAPSPHDARKNRYISFVPNNLANVAFQAEMTASTYFPDSVGVVGWVGEPDGHGIARLIEEPFFGEAWPQVVHVGDCAIVPAATYEIRATRDGTTLSDPLEISTIAQPGSKYWADVVGEFDGAEWAAPNGVVNMDDVMAGVQKFKQLDTAPPLTWVDLDPEVPNGVLNFTDIFQIVQGFKGAEYPFRAPAACP